MSYLQARPVSLKEFVSVAVSFLFLNADFLDKVVSFVVVKVEGEVRKMLLLRQF